MSILLGRDGITPWIEDAAFTDISTDWSNVAPTDNIKSRLLQRPRPVKVVQVVQFCWQTCRFSSPTNKIYCPPYMVLHDGHTSVIAFLSEKLQSRLVSTSPGKQPTEQQERDILARKPGSIVRISGWSFSQFAKCTGEHYFHYRDLSCTLTLLIEDLEILGGEGTGQTIDRPRDVNDSLKIRSTLNSLTHWELYQRLDMAHSYFNNSSSTNSKNNNDASNYYFPDLIGVKPSESLKTRDNDDDDQRHISGINEMLSDDENNEDSSEEETESPNFQTQPLKLSIQAKSPPVMKPQRTDLSEELEYYNNLRLDTQCRSATKKSGPEESESSKKSSEARSLSQPQRSCEISDETELPLEKQFDSKSKKMKYTSIAQPHAMTQKSNGTSEETEFRLETQLDTQPKTPKASTTAQWPVMKPQFNESSEETELPLEKQLKTPQNRKSTSSTQSYPIKRNFNESSKEREFEFETQPQCSKESTAVLSPVMKPQFNESSKKSELPQERQLKTSQNCKATSTTQSYPMKRMFNESLEEIEFHLKTQFDTQQPQNCKVTPKAQVDARNPKFNESSEKTELPLEPQFETQEPQNWVVALRAQPHSMKPPCNESSDETESPLKPQFDTQQPQNWKVTPKEQSHVAKPKFNDSSEETELPLEPQFDTQQPKNWKVTPIGQSHVAKPNFNELSEDTELPLEPQFNVQQPQNWKVTPIEQSHVAKPNFSESSKGIELPLEPQFDTQPPQSCQLASRSQQNGFLKKSKLLLKPQIDIQPRSVFPSPAAAATSDILQESEDFSNQLQKPASSKGVTVARDNKKEIQKKSNFGDYFLSHVKKKGVKQSEGSFTTLDGGVVKMKRATNHKKKSNFGAYFLTELKNTSTSKKY